jgi:hypothetical protein
MAIVICCTDHETPSTLNSRGGRPVGIDRLRTKSHGILMLQSISGHNCNRTASLTTAGALAEIRTKDFPKTTTQTTIYVQIMYAC